MLIPFVRSSFIGSYRICPHKAFLNYNLGIKEQSRFSTDAGTATHKALELLAQKKLAQQKGQYYFENEVFGNTKCVVDSIDERTAFSTAWWYCKDTLPHKEWDDSEQKHKYWEMYKAILASEYNPLKLEIIQPEQYFDITIEEDWARYKYNINGEKFEGFLSVKGTMDLIFQNDGYISGMDYKTGKTRVDWATGKIKGLAELREDRQLLLYSWAIKKLFGCDEFSIIMYYLQAGGPYEVSFDKQTFKVAEGMLKDYFVEISNNQKPTLAKNSANFYDKRKCQWCDYNKVRPEISKNKTVCEYYADGIVNLGMAKIINRDASPEKIFSYTGGGRNFTEKAAD